PAAERLVLEAIEERERHRDSQREAVCALTRARAALVARRELELGHPAPPSRGELELTRRRLLAERAKLRPSAHDGRDIERGRRGGEELALDAQALRSAADDRGEALPCAAHLGRLRVEPGA